MIDIKQELENYSEKCNIALSKNYTNFQDLEQEFYILINKGKELRQYLIENPKYIDKESFQVITNQSHDITKLNKDYHCLIKVIKLTQRIIKESYIYEQILFKENKFEDLINLYSRMFILSKDYHYKQKIANIFFKIYKNTDEAFLIYKNLEKNLVNDEKFWWQYFDIQKEQNNVFEAILCVKKAVDIEITKQMEISR